MKCNPLTVTLARASPKFGNFNNGTCQGGEDTALYKVSWVIQHLRENTVWAQWWQSYERIVHDRRRTQHGPIPDEEIFSLPIFIAELCAKVEEQAETINHLCKG